MLSLNMLLSAIALAAASVHAAPAGCKPTYTKTPYVMNFEGLAIPGCYSPIGCPIVTSANFSTSRGAGLALTAFSQGKPAKPWLFPNVASWQVINCTSPNYAGKDESYACVSSDSKHALYSPGKSPWDPSIRPALGSEDYEGDYTISALEALVVTPIDLPAGTKKAVFEIRGFKVGGGKTTYKATLDLKPGTKNFPISGLVAKGFTEIKKLDFWLTADNKGGQEFALDNLQLEEYQPDPLPASCTPPPTFTDTGKCKPTPTATTTFTANAEELTVGAPIPRPSVYKTLNWYPRAFVRGASGAELQPKLDLPANNTKVYLSYTPLAITANTVQQRFGVRSLDVACHFTDGTSGKPCEITFMGRRDPYDGDGLPNIVLGTISIPYAGDAASQSLTHVDLANIAGSGAGAFSRLWYFSVLAKIGDTGDATIALDNIVFERQLGGKDCSANGLQTINFDDLAPGPVPSPYKKFLFPSFNADDSDTGATSGNIALKSSPGTYPSIDTYLSPVDNQLINLDSITLTVDMPAGAQASDIGIIISGTDACGASYSSVYQFERTLVQYFHREIGFEGTGTSVRLVWAEPLRAVSSVHFQVYSTANGNSENVQFWIDDFKYRKFDGPLPGCRGCGWRGTERCEYPRILR